MISLNNITYKYPKKNGFALADIFFAIQPGEIFTLLGPNGSGKTTLIRIISGLILPKAGTVTICGHNILSRGAPQLVEDPEFLEGLWVSLLRQ